MRVIYFTGTGNSRYVAERIAEMTGTSAKDLLEEIKEHRSDTIDDEDLTVVSPVYAWRTPKILTDWIRTADLSGVRRIWYVLTCGDEIGGADKYNEKLSHELGLEHMGTGEIVMPENYIAMFNAPFEDESRRIIAEAEESILECGRHIKEGEAIPKTKENALFRAASTVGNPLFFSMFVNSKAFRAGDECIGCGKCADLCPLNNIEIRDGRPVWGKNCTHCMACICYCPTETVEYGRKSKGRFRYNFERLGIRRTEK